MIGGHWEFLEEDDVVPLVREETARLGDKALELAIGFRKTWNIAAVDYSGDWSVKSHLSGRVDAYRKAKADREEHNQKMHDELASNVKDNSADVRET